MLCSLVYVQLAFFKEGKDVASSNDNRVVEITQLAENRLSTRKLQYFG